MFFAQGYIIYTHLHYKLGIKIGVLHSSHFFNTTLGVHLFLQFFYFQLIFLLHQHPLKSSSNLQLYYFHSSKCVMPILILDMYFGSLPQQYLYFNNILTCTLYWFIENSFLQWNVSKIKMEIHMVMDFSLYFP